MIEPATAATLASAFERLPVQAGAEDVLVRLRSSGVTLGILTNASRRTLDAVLARAGLDAVIDHRVSADAVRRFKPDPAVYHLACDATGLDAARIGFVTANGWDAAGAGSFGFHVAWLENDSRSPFPNVGAARPRRATWETLVAVLMEPSGARSVSAG